MRSLRLTPQEAICNRGVTKLGLHDELIVVGGFVLQQLSITSFNVDAVFLDYNALKLSGGCIVSLSRYSVS